MTDLNDEELVRKCIAGERKYQAMLYSKFCRKMMGICFRYTGSRAEAEDMLQEGFIRVFMNLKKFRMDGSLEGWVRRIMTNTIFEKLRRKDILKNTDELESYEESNGNFILHSQEGFDELMNLVQELPDGYRTIFNMHAIDGFSHKEIAGMLSISEGTSKSQYHAARKALMMKIELLSAHG